MSEEKIAPEMAETEFSRWVEAMGIEDAVDTEGLDPEDAKAFDEIKAKIIKAIVRGDAHINDNGELVYKPRNTDHEAFTFYVPTGAVLMEMDRKKAGHDMAKMFGVAGAITKKNAGFFSNLHMQDVRFVMAVVQLFLA